MNFVPPYGRLCKRCRMFFFDEKMHVKGCSPETADTAVRLAGRPLRFYIVAKLAGVQLSPESDFAPMWFVVLYDLLNERDHEFFCVCAPARCRTHRRRRPLLVALMREAMFVREEGTSA